MPRMLVVLENPKSWDLDLPGAEVVAARAYLTDSQYANLKRARVLNLCRTYGYQTTGYYVSLLAMARRHRPLPSVTTIQDLRSSPILRVVSEDLRREVQHAMKPLKADQFTLSIYFGRNMAKRYDRLCQALYSHFPAPFLRAEFVRADSWRLDSLRPLSAADIPDTHRDFVQDRARRFFARPPRSRPAEYRYDLAILVDPEEVDAPSDARAIERFIRAAERQGVRAAKIGRDDLGWLAEYDALFLRATTSVDHFTYRFARRAEAEGLVVFDDPTSIIRCTNKVYLAELFERHRIPAPKTVIAHAQSLPRIEEELGFPVVLKRPDSSFSAGVVRANNRAELESRLADFLHDSELVVAQEFLPSDFDWRVGVIDGKARYVCKYHMVPGHWQIQKAVGEKRRKYGKTETLAVEDAPADVVALGERAASLVGDGLYGVDIKQVGKRLFVMEINDNPNIEAGVEDAVLEDVLYDDLVRLFVDRLERRRGTRGGA